MQKINSNWFCKLIDFKFHFIITRPNKYYNKFFCIFAKASSIFHSVYFPIISLELIKQLIYPSSSPSLPHYLSRTHTQVSKELKITPAIFSSLFWRFLVIKKEELLSSSSYVIVSERKKGSLVKCNQDVQAHSYNSTGFEKRGGAI